MLEFICFDSHAAGKIYAFYCWNTGKTYKESILSWNFESHLSGHPAFIGLLGKQKYWMTLLTDLYIIFTCKVSQFWKNIHKSGEMQTMKKEYQSDKRM